VCCGGYISGTLQLYDVSGHSSGGYIDVQFARALDASDASGHLVDMQNQTATYYVIIAKGPGNYDYHSETPVYV
jgi:hypothetical protein